MEFSLKKAIYKLQNRFFYSLLSLANISVFKSHAYSVDTNKTVKYRVYCFGLAEHGALGLKKENGSKVKHYVPRPVRHYFAEENCVNNVEAGFGFSVFSLNSQDNYKIYGCGINTDFQIGGDIGQGLHLKPIPVNIGLRCVNSNIKGLSTGRAHLAVTTDEGVFLLGSNCYGQCGREIEEEEKITRSTVVNVITELGGERVINVCCGQDHTLFMTDSGKVWSCGWGSDGQTGLDHTNITSTPSQVVGDIKGEKIVKIVGRCDTVLALSSSGEVFGWGNSEYNQLCENRDVQQINSSRKLAQLNGLGKIIDIAAGGSFCMVLNESGEVFVWGFGILGAGPEFQHSSKPFKLPKTLFGYNEFQPETRVCSISCGLSHLAVINNYYHLYTWGRNRYGCLGIGHIRDQYFPYKVALSAQVIKVSCGLDHTMLLCTPFK